MGINRRRYCTICLCIAVLMGGCERISDLLSTQEQSLAEKPGIRALAENATYRLYRKDTLAEVLRAESAKLNVDTGVYTFTNPQVEIAQGARVPIRVSAGFADYHQAEQYTLWRSAVEVVISPEERILTEKAIYDQKTGEFSSQFPIQYQSAGTSIQGSGFTYHPASATLQLTEARVRTAKIADP